MLSSQETVAVTKRFWSTRTAVDVQSKRVSGFSLIEVLVSLVIISLGILGVSGLLLKGLSNTHTAGMRTLVALQASSLASAMYANRAFWANPESGIIAFSSNADGSINGKNLALVSEGNCIGTPQSPTPTSCTPAQLAGADVRTWVNGINRAFANAFTELQCTPIAVGSSAYMSCVILVEWEEHFMNVSSGSNAAHAIESAATAGRRTYMLHVEL